MKYIWHQCVGGYFELGGYHTQPPLKFNMTPFNPVRITPTREVPDVKMSLDLFEYFPEGYELPEPTSSSMIIACSDDIEAIRQQWLESSIGHYHHLLSLEGLIKLDDDWEVKMQPIFEEAKKHKEIYPKYWI